MEISDINTESEASISSGAEDKIDNLGFYSYGDLLINHKQTFDNSKVNVMSMRFDSTSSYLAVGLRHGAVQLYNLNDREIEHVFDPVDEAEENSGIGSEYETAKMPATCMKWKPPTGYQRASDTLIVGYASGKIKHWDVNSKSLKSVIYEDKNQNGIYSLDINKSGSKFATGGADQTLRIYDDGLKKVEVEYSGYFWDVVHHLNRIHCVKFDPVDDNIIYSGGIDSILTIHDIRVKKPVGNISGPYIIGETIDVKGMSILAGSYRSKECIEVYDLRTFTPSNIIEWDAANPRRGGQVVAAMFSKQGEDKIIAAGKAMNDIRVFDSNSGEVLACANGFEKMIYSMDLNTQGGLLSVGTADGLVNILELDI